MEFGQGFGDVKFIAGIGAFLNWKEVFFTTRHLMMLCRDFPLTCLPMNIHSARMSNKSKFVAAVLCFFVGILGVHRFYVGKIGTGIIQLCTGGGFGVWWIIDFIVILLGNFTDKDGNKLK